MTATSLSTSPQSTTCLPTLIEITTGRRVRAACKYTLELDGHRIDAGDPL